jgi:hypothetical protein
MVGNVETVVICDLYKFFVGVCVLRAKSLHRPQLIAYGAYD